MLNSTLFYKLYQYCINITILITQQYHIIQFSKITF
nr:MAG TPA_asm: hypothetical protein [Caudoviricetes sp.]